MPHGSNNQQINCLFNSLFRFTTKKGKHLRSTLQAMCKWNPSVTSRFPSQRASNAGSVFMSWWLHENTVWSHNYANPVYGLATVCHQVRCLRWGHPSLFHTATSLLIWYKMVCVRDISYRLIWMEFINMFSVYAQSETHRRFNWWIIAVLTYNPSVLMCVEITDAPKL